VQKDKPVTVERAIKIFLADKKGARADETTIAKYELTLSRLREFCDRQGLLFILEVKLEHLSTWRETWGGYYGSNFSLRNNQSRLRHFFRYCHNAGLVSDNPATKLSAIKISDDDYEVDPYTEKEYLAILKAIPKCDNIGSVNRERVKAAMQLQRWSGLSLVDAVCLEKDELIKDGRRYRVDTSRRKSGTRVNNVIPCWLGEELLSVKNGNQQYFFWSGRSTPKSATSIYDKLYRKVFEKAGITNPGSHRFRHLFAVSLLEAGVEVRIVSRALGHKSLATTERYYAKWSTKQQATLAAALTKTWS